MRIDDLEAGARLIYPGHGVATLKRIQTQKIGGKEHKLFEFEIDLTGTKITIPAGRLGSVGLRGFGSDQCVERAYKILGERRQGRMRKTDLAALTHKMKGTLVEIAEVWRDLSTLAAVKTLSLDEQKLRDIAQRLVASEVAAVRNRRYDVVLKELKEIVVANSSKLIKQLSGSLEVPPPVAREAIA